VEQDDLRRTNIPPSVGDAYERRVGVGDADAKKCVGKLASTTRNAVLKGGTEIESYEVTNRVS
jgi:hypothetical protein